MRLMSNVTWIIFRQSLCFGVACVCVNAFHTGLLSADQALECVYKIQNMAGKLVEVSCTEKSNNIFRYHRLFTCPNKLTFDNKVTIDQ